MAKYFILLLIMMNIREGYTQNEKISALFASCKEVDNVKLSEFEDFIESYNIANDSLSQPEIEQLCIVDEWTVVGKVLYQEQGEDLPTDSYFLFTSKREEMHLFYSYPIDFENSATSIEYLSTVRVYNYDGTLKFDITLPYFEPNNYMIESYEQSGQEKLRRDLVAKEIEGVGLFIKSKLSEYSLDDYYGLLDEIIEKSNIGKARSINKKSNWYQLKRYK